MSGKDFVRIKPAPKKRPRIKPVKAKEILVNFESTKKPKPSERADRIIAAKEDLMVVPDTLMTVMGMMRKE